jgi:hypothetical protein
MSTRDKFSLRDRKYLTLQEVHRVYGRSRSSMYRHRDAGLIKFYKFGNRVLVRVEDVEKLFKSWTRSRKRQAGHV